jgi:hypothetical protein
MVQADVNEQITLQTLLQIFSEKEYVILKMKYCKTVVYAVIPTAIDYTLNVQKIFADYLENAISSRAPINVLE